MIKLKQGAELLLLSMMLAAGAAGLSGCEEGAFEDAGEEIDDAADDVEDAFD